MSPTVVCGGWWEGGGAPQKRVFCLTAIIILRKAYENLVVYNYLMHLCKEEEKFHHNQCARILEKS